MYVIQWFRWYAQSVAPLWIVPREWMNKQTTQSSRTHVNSWTKRRHTTHSSSSNPSNYASMVTCTHIQTWESIHAHTPWFVVVSLFLSCMQTWANEEWHEPILNPLRGTDAVAGRIGTKAGEADGLLAWKCCLHRGLYWVRGDESRWHPADERIWPQRWVVTPPPVEPATLHWPLDHVREARPSVDQGVAEGGNELLHVLLFFKLVFFRVSGYCCSFVLSLVSLSNFMCSFCFSLLNMALFCSALGCVVSLSVALAIGANVTTSYWPLATSWNCCYYYYYYRRLPLLLLLFLFYY